MTFKATIEARKLKHFVDVLQRLNSEAIWNVGAQGISCSIVSYNNTSLRHLKIPSGALIACVAEKAQNIGVDLDKLKVLLARAAQKDIIHLTVEDGELCVARLIHTRSIPLLNTERIRKGPNKQDLHITGSFDVSGGNLKDIVSEAKDVSELLHITMEADEVYLEATSKHVKPETYSALLRTTDSVAVPVSAMYTVGFMAEVTKDIAKLDSVKFEFASDHPCRITYTRAGVSVVAVVAPHVSSE